MADQGIKSADQGTRRRLSRKVQGSIPPPAAATVKGRFACLTLLGRIALRTEGRVLKAAANPPGMQDHAVG